MHKSLTMGVAPPPARSGLPEWGRWAMSVALAGLLVAATFCNDALYALFGSWGQALLGALGPKQPLPALQQPAAIMQVMNNPHSVLAVVAYSIGFLAVCVALLLLLLPLPAQRRLVFRFYGVAGLALLLLLGGGRVAHSVALLLLAKQLVHFVVSPLPIIVLVPLLRWYLPPAPAQA